MTKPYCDVCCGRGQIRVPLYHQLSVAAFDPRDDLRESSREYPCPECSDVVPVERLVIVKTERFANSIPEQDPRYVDAVKHQMMHMLVDDMIRQDLVKFERGPTDTVQMRFAVQMTVGVVAPRAVTTLAERIEQHQEALAREVMAEAKRQINNWGSYYGQTSLTKAQAGDSVNSALTAVLEARKKWQAA